MMDRYAKLMLTIIAGAAVAVAIIVPMQLSALAKDVRYQNPCGNHRYPCYVEITRGVCGDRDNPCYVRTQDAISVTAPNGLEVRSPPHGIGVYVLR